MIENAKQAKALGLSWLVLTFRHADGSKQVISGPFTLSQALDIFRCAMAQEDVRP